MSACQPHMGPGYVLTGHIIGFSIAPVQEGSLHMWEIDMLLWCGI